MSRHLEEAIAAAAALRPRPEIALTTNGVGLARRAAALKAGRPGPGQRVAGHRRRRAVRRTSPGATGSTDVLDGLAAAAAAGLAPVKVNAVLDPRHRPRRRGDAAAVLPASTATSCASSSRCRWTPGTSGTATRPSSADDILGALRRHFDLRPDPAPRGSAPAQLWRVDGGAGHRRRHRVGVGRLLLGVRPHPADGRRSGPQLPVLHRGDRPAGACCAAAPTTTRSRRRGGPRCGPSRPGTASTTRVSSSRTGR